MYDLIDFQVRGDERGSLVAIENLRQIPFEIKRVFFIFNTVNGTPRGCHANRKSQFVLVAISGQCKVKIKGKNKVVDICLDKQSKGLWLDSMVWKEMYDFSEGAVLLVLSSELYDKSEYINDYDEYLREVNQ